MTKKETLQKSFSKEHNLWIKKQKQEKVLILITQISLFVLIVALWEILTSAKILDPFFFSSPSRVIKSLVELFNTGQMFNHIGTTLLETVLGFSISTILGTLIAIGLWWNEKVRRVFEPYIVIFNALPKIALGPLIIIWFGTGLQSILVMCVLICIVITTLSMLNSFLSCDVDKILLMKAMKASKTQIFFLLIFPNSFGELMSVLKINVGLSWVGTIMGEYLSSRAGLGFLIQYGGQIFNINLVMASTVLLCILAGGMYFAVSKLENIYKR